LLTLWNKIKNNAENNVGVNSFLKRRKYASISYGI